MAHDLFLRLGDFPGNSHGSEHPNDIAVTSFNWGVARAGAVGTHESLSIVRQTDGATPLILALLQSGDRVEVQLYSRLAMEDAESLDYLALTFGEARILTLQVGGGSGEKPTEHISMEYRSLRISVTPVAMDGSPLDPVHYGYEQVPAPADA